MDKNNKWRRLRKSLVEEGGYCCQCCGKKKPSRRLHAHHIVPKSVSPEMLMDRENIRILCISCHKGYHALFGIKDACNKETIDAYIKHIKELHKLREKWD